jgi:RNA polymerase sigma-32 factor
MEKMKTAYTGADMRTLLALEETETSLSHGKEKTRTTAGCSGPAVQRTSKPSVQGDMLKIYLSEIGRYEILTKEEQNNLALRFKKQGDKEARSKLIASNLRLVAKIAMDFSKQSKENVLDLIQEGNVGLVKAMNKFDPRRGIKFSYYASYWIKAYILKFIMENRKLVKIGTTQNQRKLFYQLNKEWQKLRATGVKPETKMLADRLGVEEEEVIQMRARLASEELSLDSPIGDDSRESYGSFFPDTGRPVDEEVSRAQRLKIMEEKIQEFRETLSGREADIFDQRIMAERGVTLETLGAKYDVSRERIRQIQNVLIRKTQRWLRVNIPGFDDLYSDALNS